MDDLVERLHAAKANRPNLMNPDVVVGGSLLSEAAAEIASLRSQLAVAREALNLVRDGLRNLPRSKTADQIDVICAEALATPDPIADAMVAVVEAASECDRIYSVNGLSQRCMDAFAKMRSALQSLDEARSK